MALTSFSLRLRWLAAFFGLWAVAGGLLWWGNLSCLNHQALQLQVALTATQPGQGVLILQQGPGFRNAERRTFAVQGAGQPETFVFDLPAQGWTELRWGMLGEAGPWLAQTIELASGEKSAIFAGAALANRAQPGNGDSLLHPWEGGLQVAGSLHPALRIKLPPLTRLGGKAKALRFALASLGLALLGLLALWLGRRYRLGQRLGQAWKQGAGYSWLVWGCALASLVMSLLHAQQTWDPHHWGLMLSNAQDLVDGKTPYQEIFIQYGLLTTLVQAAAITLGGAHYLSLALVTSLFYGAGLVLAYHLWRLFLARSLAAFAVVAAFLCHAILFYPWSNYLAFGVAVAGLLALSRTLVAATASPKLALFSGVLLGMAVLLREETALFLGLALLCFVPLHLVFARREGQAWSPLLKRIYLPLLLGGLGVEVLFFLYLVSQGSLGDWVRQSIELKRFYVDEQFGLADRKVSLWGHLWENLNPFAAPSRKVLFTYLLLLNFGLLPWLLCRLWQRKLPFAVASPILLSSLTGLFFYLSALHVHEVFRLQTGGILTLGPALYFVQELRWRGQPALGRQGALVALAFMIGAFHHSAFWGKDGLKNQFNFHRVASPWHVGQGPLEPMKLPADLMEMYRQVEATLAQLQAQGCQLTHLENATTDGLYPLLLPLERVHKMPYLGDPANPMAAKFQSIVDPGVKQRINAARQAEQSLILAENPLLLPPHYVVVKQVTVPQERSFIGSQTLLIAAPRSCAERL